MILLYENNLINKFKTLNKSYINFFEYTVTKYVEL